MDVQGLRVRFTDCSTNCVCVCVCGGGGGGGMIFLAYIGISFKGGQQRLKGTIVVHNALLQCSYSSLQ